MRTIPDENPSPRPERPERSIGQPLVSRRTMLLGGGVAALAVGGTVWALRSGGDGAPPSTPPSTGAGQIANAPATAAPDAITPTPEPTLTPAPTPTSLPPTAEGTLVESTIEDLHGAIRAGNYTIVDLTKAALDRIAAMDGDDSDIALHAVIETNPDALAIAQTLDDELKAGTSRGPLHGIPILVKDVFASADGMKTTAGANALALNTVVEDSFVVQRLRESGAVLLGKTNMSEWAGFRSSGLGSGWSGRGGQTVNPYMLDKSPWGSSSGSAVAVAASYVPLALGAETDGSIVCPASACGVVGMKPTVGLVSRRGAIPIGFSQDSPGPIGRNVRDVAILLSAIAGYDDEDPASHEFADSAPAASFSESPIQQPGGIDYTSVLGGGLKGFRIGIARDLWGWDDAADAMMEQAISVLTDAGVEFVDDIYFDTTFDVELEYVVLITEFTDGTQRFFDRFMPDGPINSLSDVIAYNEENPDTELQFGDQEVLERTLNIGPIADNPGYEDARATMQAAARGNGIDATMDDAKVDVLIAPTAPVPTEVSSYGDAGFVGSSATPSAMAGYPSISIPIGLVDSLPVGMNIFGRAFSEKTLLKVAYEFERILQARTPPTYIPSNPADDPAPLDPATQETSDGSSSGQGDPSQDTGSPDTSDPNALDGGL